MFVDFNMVFNPTVRQQFEKQKMIFNMFSKNIGRCQTCIYAKIYIADDGYVDDCSYCMKKNSNFKQLLSFENSISCEDYSLARKRYYLILGKLTELNRKIKDLKLQKNYLNIKNELSVSYRRR